MSVGLRGRLRRFERHLLQRVYGFDRWHVGHADELYVDDVARYLNAWPEARRQAVVEIGCGLGDILRRLRFRARLGLDRDPRVLHAAWLVTRFDPRGALRFEPFDFPQSPLHGVYDAIVMVNWVHQIDPARLGSAVRSYMDGHLHPEGAVVLDTVDDPAYTYNHDIVALAPPRAVIDHLGQYPRGRHVWAVRSQ